MPTILLALLILAAWVVLQFVVQPATGWIHVLLIGGILLLIRGIVVNDED